MAKRRNAAWGTPVRAKVKSRIIVIPGRDSCWEWDGARHGNGYPYVVEPMIDKKKPKTLLVHRLMLSWKLGRELAPGEWALHKCDNPRCVRPSHLFLGDHLTNIADQVAKKRHAFGMQNGNHKLTEAQVVDVFHATGTHKEIAKRFSVSPSMVYKIKHGEHWKHLTLPLRQKLTPQPLGTVSASS